MLPHLNEVQKQQVLQSALKYRNEHESMWLLYVILPHLSESQKQQILSEVLKLALKLTDEKDCVSLLRKLIPSLSEPANQQILNAAFSIKDGVNCLNLLYVLLSYIPESSKLKLLKAIEEIKEEKWRAEGLQDLMPRFSEELQQEALRIAGNIKDKQLRSQVLEKISSSLPEPLKQQTLRDALSHALGIGDEKERGILVHSLATSLTSSLVQGSLKTTIGTVSNVAIFFSDKDNGHTAILQTFKDLIPNAMNHEAFQKLLVSKSDSELIDVLLNPVKYFPQAIRIIALQEYVSNLNDDTDGMAAVFALEIIAPQFALLPPTELYILWCYILRNKVNRPRPIFLMFLHSLVKVITTLGGKDVAKAVTLAIQDVGRWWP